MAANVQEVAAPPPPARNPVDQSLDWIGFSTKGNCNRIHDEGGLEAFDNFFSVTEINIQDMASGFSKRTIKFGMRCVKCTLDIMHWSQDERRCSCMASLTGITNAEEYKALLGKSLNQYAL